MAQIAARVLVVIVNYRTGPLTIDCLRSLAPEVAGYPGTRVVVIDNASGDGSGEAIAAAIASEGWSGWARLSASPINGGFAYGCNEGVRSAIAAGEAPDLVWLLNPDTRVRPGALSTLAGFFEGRPEVGLAGSMIEEADGTPWPYAFRFPSLLGEFEAAMRLSIVSRLLSHSAVPVRMSDTPQQVDWVSGASVMIRREVFETVGLFDENYFLYFEETDFCRAANRAGWTCWFVPDAAIMHIAGQSTGVTGKDAAARRRPRYWFDSRRRYFVKNHGRPYAVLVDLAWLVAHLTWRSRRWLQSLPDPDPPQFTRDFIRWSAIFTGTPQARPEPAVVASSRPKPTLSSVAPTAE